MEPDTDLDDLVQAVRSLNAADAFGARLSPEQWCLLGDHLTRHALRAGDLMVRQGDADRTLYFLAEGTLQVFAVAGSPPVSRIAILRAGSVVGEPGLFDGGPRLASVEAVTACVVWALTGPRFEELAQRSPRIALEVLRSAGAVMAARRRASLARDVPSA